ncbi:MAG TPA: phosphonate metabolism protein PhnM [Coleofasciculaceae cyanobacterium]|jgi:alpha-D-ribose 1-methylphosphonate 5-triphosphate diphosphatase
MNEKIYTNYRLQLPDEEVVGTLVVRDGLIADIQPDVTFTGQDGQGDYLMPGLIELHTDNLERCMSPRPGIQWPMESAVVFHDRQLVSAGVTTVYDAIALGDVFPTSLRMTHFGGMIDALHQGQLAGRFAADHRLHLRCEVSYKDVLAVTQDYIDNPLLSLISLMDHTPGQRQFVNIEKYKEYYTGKHGVPASKMEAYIQQRQLEQQQYGEENTVNLVKLAKSKNVAIASHDDATAAHVQEAIENGATIAEFPTTLEAAAEAHKQRLNVLMGAPNIVLGGSHSGNISAMELMQKNQVDILSSDYAPHSLLQAIFIIAQKMAKPLYEAMKLVTRNPANAVNLFHDRGSLEVGKRADLITVHDDGIVPRLTSVIVQGRRVA